MTPKYYLGAIGLPEQEVSKEEFIRAERAAGFRSKFGPHQVATGGFSGAGMSGRVVYVPADPKPDVGEQDQRRSDNAFYTRQLLARAAKVMDVEPHTISWFNVVAWMEEHHGA